MSEVKPLKSRTMTLEELQERTLKLIRQMRRQLNRRGFEGGLSDKEFQDQVLDVLESKLLNDKWVLMHTRNKGENSDERTEPE